MTKLCITCKHNYSPTDPRTGSPKYQRCRKSEADEKADESLCGVMRRGKCGPDAVLWEAK